MRNVLIIGATRGLGHSLTTHYAKKGVTVFATARYSTPQAPMQHVNWIPNIDIAHEGAGRPIAAHWGSDGKADLVVICANYFASETFEHLSWEKELAMYKTNAMGPIFLVKHLVNAGIVKEGSKIVLASSEKGSITLRHEIEGAADFGGHGSKAALNMVGKLLSIELKKKGIPVAIVHTGYLRKQNKEGFFEEGGHKHAVKPDVAATALMQWLDTFDLSKTGQFWAVRGAADIKTAEVVLGPQDDLPTPLELPW